MASVQEKGIDDVSTGRSTLIFLLLLTGVFTLATCLQSHAFRLVNRSESDDVLKNALGDSRRLFASQFFRQADVSFHSGYYPSIFEQGQKPHENHLVEEQSGRGGDEHEDMADFMGPPRNWIDRFGRHFRITEHTHLVEGKEREVLPWLQISAELDPQDERTYLVGSYMLRTRLNKPLDAETFLRQGLQANPNSYEILFEMGTLYHENFHDATRARNAWLSALRRWQQVQAGREKPDNYSMEEIAMNLARLERDQGNLAQAIDYLDAAKKVSPDPDSIQQQIDELRKRQPTK